MSEAVRAQPAVDEGSVAAAAPYCGRCGEPAPAPHSECAALLALEPPRYCPHCRRRLIVQVLPTGYTARCSAHGEL